MPESRIVDSMASISGIIRGSFPQSGKESARELINSRGGDHIVFQREMSPNAPLIPPKAPLCAPDFPINSLIIMHLRHFSRLESIFLRRMFAFFVIT
jgi:hypothetical protein